MRLVQGVRSAVFKFNVQTESSSLEGSRWLVFWVKFQVIDILHVLYPDPLSGIVFECMYEKEFLVMNMWIYREVPNHYTLPKPKMDSFLSDPFEPLSFRTNAFMNTFVCTIIRVCNKKLDPLEGFRSGPEGYNNLGLHGSCVAV